MPTAPSNRFRNFVSRPPSLRLWMVALLFAAPTLSRSADEVEPPAAGAEAASETEGASEADAKPVDDQAAPVDFARDVMPLLRKNCLACHSETLDEAGLVLESVEAIRAGGDSGSAIDVDDPGESLLVARASGELEPLMPPPDNNVGAEPLTEEQLALLERWIAQGAPESVVSHSAAQAWQPLPTTLQPIYAAAVSPDGRYAASGRRDAITLYDLARGTALPPLVDPALTQSPGGHEATDAAGAAAAHRDFVHALAFHPDGDLLASGDFRVVKLWRRVTTPQTLEAAELESLRGQVGEDATVQHADEIDEETRQHLAGWEIGGELRGLVRSPDGQRAVTIIAEGPAQLWDWNEGTSLGPLTGDPQLTAAAERAEHDVARQRALAERIAGRIPDAEKRIESEAEARQKVEEEHKKAADDHAEKKKGVEEAEAALAAFDAPPSEPSDEAEPAAEDEATEANDEEAAEPADEEAAKKAEEEAAKKAEERAMLETKLAEAKTALEASTAALEAASQALASSVDGHQRAQAALERLQGESEAEQARIEPLEQLAAAAAAAAAEAQRGATHAAFSPDSQRLAVALEEGQILLFLAVDAAAQAVLRGGPTDLQRLAFSEEGRHLLAWSAEGELTAWDSEVPWELERVLGSEGDDSPFSDRVVALDFSPDGAQLAVGTGEPSRSGDLHLVSLSDGTIPHSLEGLHSDVVLSVRFSPCGRYLATGGADRQVRVFETPAEQPTPSDPPTPSEEATDAESGEGAPGGVKPRTLEGHTHHVLAVGWQDDGQRLASASADNTIKIWDPHTRQSERTITGAGKEATALTFLGTSSQLASTSGDATVRIHDANNGNQVRALAGAATFQHAVSTDRAGTHVAAGGEDGILRLWKAESGELLYQFGSE